MKRIYITSLFILIAGCSAYTPMPVEPLETPTHFKEAIKGNPESLEKKWWRNFNDAQLNQLVEQALKNNINYKITLNDRDAAKDMAANQVDMLEAKSRMAQLTLVSEVASVYFTIATLNANIHNVTRQDHIVNALLKIANTQYDIGYIESNTLREAKTKEKAIKKNLENLKKQQKIYMYNLADLLGQYAEDFNVEIKPASSEIEFQPLLPATVPAEMLANRPDIQLAFLQVQHANGGKSPYENALLNYKNTVLTAFQEVDNALLSFKEDQASLILDKKIVKDASDDYQSAEIQYHAGEIDYATSLSFELRLLQSEYDLANQNLLVYEDIIQVYKSLGLAQ